MRNKTAVAYLVVGGLCLTNAGDVNAQAWLPFEGEASLSLSYSYFDGGDHLFPQDLGSIESRGYKSDGKRWFLGDTYAHTTSAAVEYGLSKRVALGASLSFVRSQYRGRSPLPADIDGWHGGVTDVRFDARWQALRRPFVVTPSLAFQFPVRDYLTGGHASEGSGVNELEMGIHVGRSLSRSVYAHVSGTYTIIENPEISGETIQLDRWSVSGSSGFSTGRFTLFGSGTYVDTVDGSEWVLGDGSDHGELFTLNGQIGASRFLRTGGGVGVEAVRSVFVSVEYLTTVWGENVDDANVFLTNFTWSFDTPFVPRRTRR